MGIEAPWVSRGDAAAQGKQECPDDYIGDLDEGTLQHLINVSEGTIGELQVTFDGPFAHDRLIDKLEAARKVLNELRTLASKTLDEGTTETYLEEGQE